MEHPLVMHIRAELNKGGIPAEGAFPGGRMPMLTEPSAAVQLGTVGTGSRTASVLVTVMSPASMGGGTCDLGAMQVVEILRGLGGACKKGLCRFDERADCFCTEVQAEFHGLAGWRSWTPGRGFRLTLDGAELPHAVSFGILRSVGSEGLPLGVTAWEFTLEECFPPGAETAAEVTEPFTLVLTRGLERETYTDCTWLSIRRTEEPDGMHQIRTGSIGARAVPQ